MQVFMAVRRLSRYFFCTVQIPVSHVFFALSGHEENSLLFLALKLASSQEILVLFLTNIQMDPVFVCFNTNSEDDNEASPLAFPQPLFVPRQATSHVHPHGSGLRPASFSCGQRQEEHPGLRAFSDPIPVFIRTERRDVSYRRRARPGSVRQLTI